MRRFEPFDRNITKGDYKWVAEGTHFVGCEPYKSSLLEDLFEGKFTEPTVRVAAFNLEDTLIYPIPASYQWNWKPGALAVLKDAIFNTYQVVIFANRGSMYVDETSLYWVNSAFADFYKIINKVLRSYMKFTGDEPPFVLVAPMRPSSSKHRRSPKFAHENYRKPNTGMWKEFEHSLKSLLGVRTTIDLENSFYVGCRDEDMEFAKNVEFRL